MNNNTSKDNLIHLIVSNIRVFIIVFILSAVFSIVLSLLLPKWYKSSVTILPPQEVPAQSMMSNLPLNFLGSNFSDIQIQRYISILESRSVIERVVEKFDLVDIYETDTKEAAINEFNDNSYHIVTEEGALEISVLDKNQNMVADIANYYINVLDSINRELTAKKAQHSVNFLKKRIDIIYEEIKQLQNSMISFQNKFGVIDIETQSQETITAIANLRYEKILKEIEYEVLESTLPKNDPRLSKLLNEMKSIEEKIRGIKQSDKHTYDKIYKSLDLIPELTAKYLNIFSQIEIKRKVLEFIVPEYERARIEESKNTPTLQILDRAYRPELKAKPKRALIVISTVFAALFFTLVIVIYRNS